MLANHFLHFPLSSNEVTKEALTRVDLKLICNRFFLQMLAQKVRREGPREALFLGPSGAIWYTISIDLAREAVFKIFFWGGGPSLREREALL